MIEWIFSENEQAPTREQVLAVTLFCGIHIYRAVLSVCDVISDFSHLGLEISLRYVNRPLSITDRNDSRLEIFQRAYSSSVAESAEMPLPIS
jgi:hypothetical protein